MIVDEPWISRILAGTKTWEMRSQATVTRGTIALIRKGSGRIVGTARIVGCKGPLTIRELATNAARHQVPMEEFESGRAAKWTTAWELAEAKELASPMAYRHPFGAVIWVNLEPGVEAAILAQCEEVPIKVVVGQGGEARPAIASDRREIFSLAPAVLVPVASDGTWFGPHLLRAGQFTVGEKGGEQRLDSFEQALSALAAMDVPRWRRPNAKGNWGIVSGTRWARVGDLNP